MPHARHAGTDDQATQPSNAPPGTEPGARRPGLAGLLTGAGLCVLVLLLGALAKTGPVARLDLRADEHIAAHDRTSMLTALAKAATTIATPETIGVGLMIVVPLILLAARRRLDAAKVFCMFAGALALAEIAKKLINEHRPPASVQAIAADHTPSASCAPSPPPSSSQAWPRFPSSSRTCGGSGSPSPPEPAARPGRAARRLSPRRRRSPALPWRRNKPARTRRRDRPTTSRPPRSAPGRPARRWPGRRRSW
jgi:hypothetical protein